jgi:hypothetical protein
MLSTTRPKNRSRERLLQRMLSADFWVRYAGVEWEDVEDVDLEMGLMVLVVFGGFFAPGVLPSLVEACLPSGTCTFGTSSRLLLLALVRGAPGPIG